MKNFIILLAFLCQSSILFGQVWTGSSLGGSTYRHGRVGLGVSEPSARLDIWAGRSGLVVYGDMYGSNTTDYQASFTFFDSGIGETGIKLNKKNAGSNFTLLSAFYNAQEVFTIRSSGKVGIGTTNPDAPLTVAGNIHAREIKVTATAGGADFVFADDYTLPTLHEVEAFVKKNKHLPEIPSAAEMEANGLHLAEMNIKLLQKVEELTLYAIEQEKKMEEQLKQKDQEIAAILKRLTQLEASK